MNFRPNHGPVPKSSGSNFGSGLHHGITTLDHLLRTALIKAHLKPTYGLMKPFNRSPSQMNKRNPTHKRDFFGTQFSGSKLDCLSSLGSIRPGAGCCRRTILVKKGFIECICNLGAIGVSNGPENNQDIVHKAYTINSPHSCNNSTETCK